MRKYVLVDARNFLFCLLSCIAKDLKKCKKVQVIFLFLGFLKNFHVLIEFLSKMWKKALKYVCSHRFRWFLPCFSWLRITKLVGRRMVSRNWGRLTRKQRSLVYIVTHISWNSSVSTMKKVQKNHSYAANFLNTTLNVYSLS